VKGLKLAIAIAAGALVVAVIAGAFAFWRALENPDELWAVVQNCVANKQHGHTLRAGCLSVDLRDQVAVLPGIIGRHHYLVVPTVRITGIEDPRLRDPHLPNYWALAWAAANRYLPKRMTRNRARIALAINSEPGRSQNQLHIHVACLKRQIRLQLAADAGSITSSWSQPMVRYGPQTYRVMRVEGATLGRNNPFALLLKVPGAAADMGDHTLVVSGAVWDSGKKEGFYILDDVAHDTPNGPDHGHGEDLLDEGCGSEGLSL
jgi:CDP-diacylglycerol pyrophosphatase